MKKKAFTLIELLIVIALLGALAVGLLAALDPFEQLKKGTDTGVRNTVSEVHGAIIRYYAVAVIKCLGIHQLQLVQLIFPPAIVP